MPNQRLGYSGGAVQTALVADLSNTGLVTSIQDASGWPTAAPFPVVVAPGTGAEEKMLVTRSSTNLNITTRGYDGTTALAHTAGDVIYPCLTAAEMDQFNWIASRAVAKGDMLVSDSNGILQRIPAGTDGQAIVADATASLGVKYASPSAMPPAYAGPHGTDQTIADFSHQARVGLDGDTAYALAATQDGDTYLNARAGHFVSLDVGGAVGEKVHVDSTGTLFRQGNQVRKESPFVWGDQVSGVRNPIPAMVQRGSVYNAAMPDTQLIWVAGSLVLTVPNTQAFPVSFGTTVSGIITVLAMNGDTVGPGVWFVYGYSPTGFSVFLNSIYNGPYRLNWMALVW